MGVDQMRCLNDTVGLEQGRCVMQRGAMQQLAALREWASACYDIMLITVTHPREDQSFPGKIECFNQP